MFQAALSLVVRQRALHRGSAAWWTPRRRLLEKSLSEPARAALARVARAYAARRPPRTDVRKYLEGAELTAVRAGLFVAGEMEPVKKHGPGRDGSTFRVPARTKLRELMVFATSEDLHELRVAVGTHVEVQVRK